MKDEKKSGGGTGIGVGSSSILVIFVVLCLTTFATLSLTSAKADYRLTGKAAESVLAYYAADSAAEEQLARLSGCIAENRAELLPSVLALEGFTCVVTEGRTVVSYDIEISPEKQLHVEVEADTLNRLCWQVQSTVEPKPAQDSTANIGNLPVL